jgi:hypothetical protein
MYELKKQLERYLRVNLLGPGPRLMKKEFTGPQSYKRWETLLYAFWSWDSIFRKGTFSSSDGKKTCIYPRVFQTGFIFHLSHALVCIFIRFSQQIPEPKKIVAEWLRGTDVITCDIVVSFLEIRLLSESLFRSVAGHSLENVLRSYWWS